MNKLHRKTATTDYGQAGPLRAIIERELPKHGRE
jgi:hypothetical protein